MKEIALLFSGGLDTTLEVVERLKEYDAVHLLTFNNGCCINMGGAERRVAELKEVCGEAPLRHIIIDTRPLMKTLLEDHKDAWQSYHSPLVFDLVCKLAAITELIYYSKINDISDISDGAAIEQTQIFLQHPDFTEHIAPFMTRHGLTPRHPVQFSMKREDKIKRLKELNFHAGTQALEKLHITSQLAHQPFCLRGFVTFFFTSPLRHLGLIKRRGLSLPQAKELWNRLLPVAEAHLTTQLAAHK